VSQEKPELVITASPVPKLPRYTSLFSLQFPILSRCFVVVLLEELQAACQVCLCTLAALLAIAAHVNQLPCPLQGELGSKLGVYQPPC